MKQTLSENVRTTYVRSMFNAIAKNYDFLNHLLSAGIDIWWRKKAMQLLFNYHPKKILDVACGTGDLSITAAEKISPQEIIGVDIAEEMLHIGRKKIVTKNLQHIIRMENGNAENLQFEGHYFDAAIVAFGVRNFTHLEKGLNEMRRILKENGTILILEFSQPQIFPFRQLYFFYFTNILPLIGKIFSQHDEAYHYLPNTVMNFPDGERFISILKNIGFKNPIATPLTFGIATIYIAQK